MNSESSAGQLSHNEDDAAALDAFAHPRAQVMDPWLLFAGLALAGIGLVCIYSASGWNEYLASQSLPHPSFDGLLRKQSLFVVVGILLCIGLARTDYRLVRRFAMPMLAASMVGLIAARFLGPEINGATRWIRIAGISIQPSEFAKVALVGFLAAMLARKGELVQSFARGYVPSMLAAGFTMSLVVLGKDLGTTILMGGITLGMLYVAGARILYMLGTVLAVLPVVWGLIAAQPYRLQRVADYLSDGGHQVKQSLIAIGSGGIWGLGLGLGRQKLGPLPENHNDFILASLAEELGLIGIYATIALYLLLVWRGLRAVEDATDRFGAYLAAGFATMFGGQALLNMAVVFKIVPAKGIALPFVSSGGSSMLASMIALGLMLSVSRRARPSRWSDMRRPQRDDSRSLATFVAGLREKMAAPRPPSRRGRPNVRR